MKTTISILFSTLLISLSGCQPEYAEQKSRENLTLADFDCLNKQASQPLTLLQANKWIYGEWQLYGMQTMLPTKQIPDLKIVLSHLANSLSEKSEAEIFENGVSKGRVKFIMEVVKWEGYTNVTVESENISLPADYYNFIKGNIRICESELMIDNGMAFDAPAYFFRKMKK